MNLFFLPSVSDGAKGFFILVGIIVVGYGSAMCYELWTIAKRRRGYHRKVKKAMHKHLQEFRNSDDPPTRKGGF